MFKLNDRVVLVEDISSVNGGVSVGDRFTVVDYVSEYQWIKDDTVELEYVNQEWCRGKFKLVEAAP